MSDTTSRAAGIGPGGAAAKPPLWIPSRERLRASNLVHFAAWLAGSGHDREGGPAALASVAEPSRDSAAPSHDPQRGYDALWRWSIEQQEGFWDSLWDWCGIVGDKGERVFEEGDGMAGARYFPDARLNFAENLLRRRTDEPAIMAWAEDGRRRVVSWRELHDLVSRVSQAMRDAGVGPGDRVAALLPNVPEAVVVLLAATSVGAVLSTASPDFGVRGVGRPLRSGRPPASSSSRTGTAIAGSVSRRSPGCQPSSRGSRPWSGRWWCRTWMAATCQ